ncbi:tripartite ATP-independent transporter DctP family solute receptor [Anoxybacillus vitaminiphilus]|uniref:Tripartite ATP-independent transporter DctP family solute receptor n=1 Tax=Paranoxybacillus vitaminiphilus TaxID=581036 RepID=A0A327YVM6_9BACL|nr:TRAP transporter substrate-binding protein [Anoxybacillus vitaminiphilus]RAK22069.1 tripartite ATP-independent transporter DctP family solute receptor [Anoxybacillus vitaminiphilus]
MKKMKWLAVILAVMLAVVSGCGQKQTGNNGKSSDKDGVKTIKIAHYFAADHPQNIALKEKFKPMVEEKTNGKIKVEIYEANKLGDEASFTNGVRNGTIEMAIAGMGLQTAQPKIGVVEWPYLFKDYEHARKVLNGEVGEEIKEEFRKLGVEPIGWTVNGFRVVSANRPIKSMDDFKGFRLRMPNVPIFVETGKAMGANVTPMALSEVFTALEQKVIDGQENPYLTLKANGWYEVQSHVIETNHMFSPNVYLINKKLFDGFDKETQEIILEAAKASADYQWELALKAENEVKDFLKKEGLEIIVPDREFRSQLEKSVEPVYEKLYKQYDWAEELVKKIREQ